MTEIDETIPSGTTARQPCEGVRHKHRIAKRTNLLRLGWWTVPVHMLLGFGFWWFMQYQPDQLGSILLWIHVGFPCLLLLTVRCWWNQWGELLALLLMNHAATFGVLICMPYGS